MSAAREFFKKNLRINIRWRRSRFVMVLLGLAGLAGTALLMLTASWEQAGPVVVVAFIAALGLSELVSNLPGPGFKRVGNWLNRANIPLFILCAATLVYEVIAILTMPEK